jgi:hypothetical protein
MDRYRRAGTRYQAASGNRSVAGMTSEGDPFWVRTFPLRAVRRGLDLPPADKSKAPVPGPRVGGSEGDRAGAPGLTGTGPSQNIEDRPSSLPLFVGRAKNGRPRKFARGHFYTGGGAVGSTAPWRVFAGTRAPLWQLAMGSIRPLRRPRRLPSLSARQTRPARWPPCPCGTGALPARGYRSRGSGRW